MRQLWCRRSGRNRGTCINLSTISSKISLNYTYHQNWAVSIFGRRRVPKTFKSPLKSRIHSMIRKVWKGLASYEGWYKVAKNVIWNAITATFDALPHSHEKRFAHPVNQLWTYVSSSRHISLLAIYLPRMEPFSWEPDGMSIREVQR